MPLLVSVVIVGGGYLALRLLELPALAAMAIGLVLAGLAFFAIFALRQECRNSPDGLSPSAHRLPTQRHRMEHRVRQLSTSQFGEDRLLDKLFQHKHKGVCVEVGANNGVNGNTTLHFEELGRDCILVEPNPTLCRELRARRRLGCSNVRRPASPVPQSFISPLALIMSHAVSALEIKRKPEQILKEHGSRTEPVEVPIRRLDDILEEARPSDRIDFISIDVEGHELNCSRGSRWIDGVPQF